MFGGESTASIAGFFSRAREQMRSVVRLQHFLEMARENYSRNRLRGAAFLHLHRDNYRLLHFFHRR